VSQQVGILDWHQEVTVRPTTFIPKWAAELLVARLAAEKVSSRIIRRFAPDSVFYARQPLPETSRFIPSKLPPVEVGNCRFVPPFATTRPSPAAIREGWDWTLGQTA
jgi:hypothetical protein